MVQPILAPIANITRNAVSTGIVISQCRRLDIVNVVHIDLRHATVNAWKDWCNEVCNGDNSADGKINALIA